MTRRLGFLPGVGAGALLAVTAWLLAAPATDGAARDALTGWIGLNLGHSVWLFAAVLVLFTVHLTRLGRCLDRQPDRRVVVELDQLTDVWVHVFVGIGVIWTAVGMRAALQVTLADPARALDDSAGSVLQKLVDGGILLALSTTIVGAVGGYLMRLAKTVYTGAALHDFYQGLERAELKDLLAAVLRVETALQRAASREVNGAAG